MQVRSWRKQSVNHEFIQRGTQYKSFQVSLTIESGQKTDLPYSVTEDSNLTCIQAAQTSIKIDKYPSKNAQAFFLQRDSGFKLKKLCRRNNRMG